MVHDRHVNSAMQIQITDISLLMLLLMAVMLQPDSPFFEWCMALLD